MCGIVGILGSRPAAPLLVDGLKRLEYRGYDSSGIATLNGHGLERRRAQGKLASLSEVLEASPLDGLLGIGHTRWATHGAPNEANAHPHGAPGVMLVHNGIIENFRELRDELQALGHSFESDTDTEVIAQLVSHHLGKGAGPADAVRDALHRLEGAFALAILFEGEDDLLIAARRGSPLAIGLGDGEMYVGSDAFALAPLTNRLIFLEDGDWAVLTRRTLIIRDEAGSQVVRPERLASVSAAMADKGNYRHFMLKEIHEQPAVIGRALGAYFDPVSEAVRLPATGLDFAAVPKITMSACGTAFYAAMVAKHWFETLARIPVEVDIASEFRYREPVLPKDGVGIFISQSGETADTMAALRYANANDQHTIAVVNVEESTIAREADHVFPIHAGPEIGVASTKAFTCQCLVLASLAVAAARQRGTINAEHEKRLVRALMEVPGHITDILRGEEKIHDLAHEISKATDVLYLGRGASYPIALEGALKLKEISYIHAEGYAAGELKHGPIALIDEEVPVIVLAPHDKLFEKTASNMHEVIARGGLVVLLSDSAGIAEAGHEAWATVEMPAVDPFVAPLVYAIPIQLLAYHTAVIKGTDVDQPRNLAKSVTVE